MLENIENSIHDFIVECSGLPPTMVRPELTTLPTPPVASDWASFALLTSRVENFINADGDTVDENEVLRVHVSFFGKNSYSIASRFRTFTGFEPNRYYLIENQLYLMAVEELHRAPTLVNEQWLRRWDVEILIGRHKKTTLPMPDLLSASVTLLVNK